MFSVVGTGNQKETEVHFEGFTVFGEPPTKWAAVVGVCLFGFAGERKPRKTSNRSRGTFPILSRDPSF